MLFRFALPSVWGAIATLRKRRSYPDTTEDKRMFDIGWAGSPALDETDARFLKGEEPHQVAITKRLELDLSRARSSLDAVANETSGYLTTCALLLAVVGFVVSGGKADTFWQSPQRLIVWGPALILILLLRVHASKLSSWFDNYEGAGAKAAQSNSQYAFVNSIREDILRYNARMQRAIRLLALVHLLFIVVIAVTGVIVTVG